MENNLTPMNQNSPCSAPLSGREKVCIVNYFFRKSSKETARELSISPRSVETYLRRVQKKIGGNKKEIFKTLLQEGIFQKSLNDNSK